MPKPKRAFSSEELGLLDAIRADPRSDIPRYIYADWMEDCGEPERAEFIRLQCQDTREFGGYGFLPYPRNGFESLGWPGGPTPRTAECRAAHDRQMALLLAHPEWYGHRFHHYSPVIRRGFVILQVGQEARLMSEGWHGRLRPDEFVTLDVRLGSLRRQDHAELFGGQLAHYVSVIYVKCGSNRAERDRFIDAIIGAPLLSRLENLFVAGRDEPLYTDLMATVVS